MTLLAPNTVLSESVIAKRVASVLTAPGVNDETVSFVSAKRAGFEGAGGDATSKIFCVAIGADRMAGLSAAPIEMSEEQCERNRQRRARNHRSRRSPERRGRVPFCLVVCSALCSVISSMGEGKWDCRGGKTRRRGTNRQWDSSAWCQQDGGFGYCIAQNRSGEALAYTRFIGNAANNVAVARCPPLAPKAARGRVL